MKTISKKKKMPILQQIVLGIIKTLAITYIIGLMLMGIYNILSGNNI